MKKIGMLIIAMLIATKTFAEKAGMVEYVGAQKNIFVTGKAESVINLKEFAKHSHLYAIGPVEGLDGEITVFNSKPYVSKIRGEDYEVAHSFDCGAFFLSWTTQKEWQEIKIPEQIQSYIDLQAFVKNQAALLGIDVTKPFPFLLSGTPKELKWHINIDRTNGQFITKELFSKSKQFFVSKSEPIDVLGFYSENHAGLFINQYSPAIKPDSGIKNNIHIHFISNVSKATGHIDDLTLGANMLLKLPHL
jgi:acetolactate decarboxylase